MHISGAGGFACVVDCWCGAVDSRKHLARPRTSASGGRQGAWWHDAATQADARVQAGADVPAESANDAPEGCACGTASNFDRADGSGCGASGGSMEAAAARRTAAATGWESRSLAGRDPGIGWLPRRRRPRPPLEAQGCANFETGVCVVKGTASPRDWSTLNTLFWSAAPRGQNEFTPTF